MHQSTSFTLDTDIGTDVDDLLAIAMILGSPELELDAVCTVYGDVHLRAQIVAAVFATVGRPAPPIALGERETRSGREVWWAGHEGETIQGLTEHTYAADRDGVSELAAAHTVAAIGPLTDVAAAVENPDHGIRRIVMMGGEFSRGIVEHNIRCDVAAADEVFESRVPLLAVGLEQTERIRLAHAELDRIAEAGPLGAMIGAEMRRFWSFAEQDYNVPHDPIAVLTLARPDLFEVTRGVITVQTEGKDAGLTRFAPTADGPHEIVTDMDEEAVATEILERILRAAQLHP
ncbi:nucleoside hydrolase [Microbacterium sp. XT11]|uniref:nucleoside hydrolase n=1 Tax=Microbacterium sp. XT11 TaxID=367477 RepID=UPI000742E003|nr:nucleoside hydrolase [Microbacterium sp. XT11]ALX66425.1 Inosine/uridine-preferring nucleoside hydrolase [Microbacterium sp. XT11]